MHACAQLTLCGQAPEAALTAALASVNFFCGQLELAGRWREGKAQRRAGRVQELCKKKLEEVHAGYTAVRARCCAVISLRAPLPHTWTM